MGDLNDGHFPADTAECRSDFADWLSDLAAQGRRDGQRISKSVPAKHRSPVVPVPDAYRRGEMIFHRVSGVGARPASPGETPSIPKPTQVRTTQGFGTARPWPQPIRLGEVKVRCLALLRILLSELQWDIRQQIGL